MALRIEIDSEQLDQSEGFKLEVDLKSPVFNDEGSQSAALTLPSTLKNRSLLSQPQRLDVTRRRDTAECVLYDGAMSRHCLLSVLSASEREITVSLGTDESLMYESWQDTLLRDIPDLPLFVPDGDSYDERLNHLIELCDSIYNKEDQDSPYRIFPVALEFEDTSDTADITALPRAVIINRLERHDQIRREDALAGTRLKSSERDMSQSLDKDSFIHVPKGYGISPFLRVSPFLHFLFEAFGYTLLENVFDTDPQLKELVILNNCMDAICAARIDWRDLLPSVSVNDFLQALRAHFGAVFYLDATKREARCVLLQESLTSDPDLDLTMIHSTRPLVTMNRAQQLVLSCRTSYQRTATEEQDLAAFLSKYSDYIDLMPYAGKPSIVFDRFSQTFLRKASNPQVFSFMSSMHYKWDRKDKGYEPYSLDSPDEAIALLHYTGQGDETYQDKFNLYALPLYLSGVRNAHTAVKSSSAFAQDDTLEKETDLAFCFSHGIYMTDDGYDLGFQYGSPYANRPDGQHYIDSDGNEYTYSLTFDGEDGAYNRFLRPFDRLLRHSNRVIETAVSLSRPDFQRLDLSLPKLLFGQKVLIDTLKVVFPLDDNRERQVSLRTMRHLDPVDSTAGLIQHVTRPHGYWLVESNLDSLMTSMRNSVRSYLEENNQWVSFKSFKFLTSEYNLPTDLRNPTDEEIALGATRTFTYRLRLIVDYSWRNNYIIMGDIGSGTYFASDTTVTETWTAVAYPQ